LNPENPNQYRYGRPHPKNRRLGGLIIIIAGVVLLLARMPQTANYFPAWLFTWPVLLIALGIFFGAVHGFRRGFGWLILILTGLGFLLYQQHAITAPLSLYILPAALIVVGLFIVFNKRYHSFYSERWKWREQRWQQMSDFADYKRMRFAADSSDYANINSSFRSVEKKFLSKNFQGVSITCSFGSCELDLTQVDFERTATIDISLNFGNIEIMLPSNWAIQNELSTVASAIDDVRRETTAIPDKTLILKGKISFGSVEIKN
ncbi:MAG: LiaF-related protein, partial [Chitinophagaceae bacterium]|nr:LiaF-related protein [Chitinophagaceae bacterium]